MVAKIFHSIKKYYPWYIRITVWEDTVLIRDRENSPSKTMWSPWT